jgi:hypothetical protein
MGQTLQRLVVNKEPFASARTGVTVEPIAAEEPTQATTYSKKKELQL